MIESAVARLATIFSEAVSKPSIGPKIKAGRRWIRRGNHLPFRGVQSATRHRVRVRGMVLKPLLLLIVMVNGPSIQNAQSAEGHLKRFFHSGDGVIHIASEKNGHSFHGRYRSGGDQYDEDAYKAICTVFGAPRRSGARVLSLRLIEFLDYLEDHLGKGARITITSGYRAPSYNTRLRKGGALAAKASLHQYGMAADFIMEGVSSKRIWEYVRSLGFGGTGYYHARTVHVDVGPARFWDEKTSGVGTGLSDDNKLIGLVADLDVYRPDETVSLTFIRMTAFPIQVRSDFKLIFAGDKTKAGGGIVFRPDKRVATADACIEFSDINQMASLRWALPPGLPKGRYQITAGFCTDAYEKMPREVSTPVFLVQQR